MKNRMKKLLVLATAATMMTAAFTGCGSSSDGADNNADTSADKSADEGTSNENLSGSLSLAGSTSMEKLCEALKESFMEKNPGVTVTVEYTGSGSGIESVTAGSVDIGDSSRALTDDEKANGVEENIVAIDGIAVITDKDNSVTELTSDDLKKIYTGEISNWKDLGGKDEAIVAIGREAASGTRGAFEELLDVKDQCKYAQELDSTGAVLAKVGSTPGAIGYVSLDVLDDTVTAMKIDGVEATEENIVAGKYLLSRLNPNAGISAAERLDNISREELSGMLYENSDEPYCEELAKAITDEIRKGNRIDTTTKLRHIIEQTLDFLPEKDKKDIIKKTCQRTFQALRIDVNHEFEVLYEFMEKLPGALKPGGRAAILTFHSGEDKLVKKALKAGYKAGIYSDYSKDVIRPSAQECAQNGRARSTKMRWAVRAE